jgi:MATE family multidrug resistance protein
MPYSTIQQDRLVPWKTEMRAMLKLGIPMGLTQLVQFFIYTIDVLMIGRLGPDELAASSLGIVIFFTLFLLGFGPAMASSPMVSQALGADENDTTDVRRSVRMAIWFGFFVFPIALAVVFFSERIALALGQPPELAALAQPYLIALAPGLPFALGVIVLRNFLAAIDRTRVPLVIIIITTVINATLNYLLIYGNFGFPRLELVGAGIASSFSYFIGFCMLIAYIQRDKRGQQFDLLSNPFKPDWPRFKEVVQLGWPIGATSAFEGMLFNACVLVMGVIGVNEVASYQISVNLAALAFMIPLGFSMAGATRVGLAEGAGNRDGVRRATWLTIFFCIVTIMVVAVPAALVPEWIAGLYIPADKAENAEVVRWVIVFLPMAAAFMLFDAVQVAANQCLRGLKDVRVPMVLTGISYWGIGFPIAYYLGLHTSAGPAGVWWGLTAGLAAASVTLGARLWWVARK